MSEWPSNWISDPAQVSALIDKWRGATAQGWAYSVSHAQLLIRVHWEREPVDVFSLFLYFKNCSRIAFDDTWPDFDLKIAEVAGEFGPEFEASDAGRLYVRCGGGPFAYETETFLKLSGRTMTLLTFEEQSSAELGFGSSFPESCFLGKVSLVAKFNKLLQQ